MTIFDDIDEYDLIILLKKCVDYRYWNLMNFTDIKERAEIEDDVIWFNCGILTIGLKKDTLEFQEIKK